MGRRCGFLKDSATAPTSAALRTLLYRPSTTWLSVVARRLGANSQDSEGISEEMQGLDGFDRFGQLVQWCAVAVGQHLPVLQVGDDVFHAGAELVERTVGLCTVGGQLAALGFAGAGC